MSDSDFRIDGHHEAPKNIENLERVKQREEKSKQEKNKKRKHNRKLIDEISLDEVIEKEEKIDGIDYCA